MNKNYFSSYKPENCLVVNGGKLGIFLTLQAMLKAGDEVLLPSPYWVSYPAHAKLFKGKLKLIQTNESNGWKISAKDIQKAASRKAKFLVINSANNPTGAVYSKKEFAEILSIAKKLNLLVISDEVYSSLVYGNKKFVSAASFKKYKDRVIVIQSCSKNFAMTGFRVGFVFAPKEIVSVLTNLLSQSTSGADTLAQWAALAALKNHLQITFKIKLEMQKRREVFFREFERNFKVKLKWPDSSIYAFLPISAFGSKEKSSIKFCKTILEKTNVVLVPGIAFGREGYVRCSFGEKERIIRQAIKRIAKFLNK